jgi:hypothetical protein
METKNLAENPEQLTKRLDRMYLTLAVVYERIGRALGIGRREARPQKRRGVRNRGDRRRDSGA